MDSFFSNYKPTISFCTGNKLKVLKTGSKTVPHATVTVVVIEL